MLTKQQAAIVDHLKRTNQNGYIHPENPLTRRLAQRMLPIHKPDVSLYGGTPDELAAYYEEVNKARMIQFEAQS